MTGITKRKHRAVLNIQLIVYPVDDHNQCMSSLEKSQLEQFGLRPKMCISLEGFDMHECLSKLARKLSEFNV